MDLELKNVSVYSKDLYWMLKAVDQLEKEFKMKWVFLNHQILKKFLKRLFFN